MHDLRWHYNQRPNLDENMHGFKTWLLHLIGLFCSQSTESNTPHIEFSSREGIVE